MHLHKAQPGTVEELGHEEMRSGEGTEEAGDLVAVEDGREVVRAAGSDRSGGWVEGDGEGVAIEEEKGGECLVVCGRGDVEGDGQMGEEGLDRLWAEGTWVFEAMEAKVAADPVEVGGFGAKGVVSAAQGIPDVIDQGWTLAFHGIPLRIP